MKLINKINAPVTSSIAKPKETVVQTQPDVKQTEVTPLAADSLSQLEGSINKSKKDILDIFSEKVVNKNDINDMVQVPRTIFKGYLCFTAGTAINAISSAFKTPKIKNPLAVIGSLISIYGTYNFVKPFLVKTEQKEENLTKS